MIFYCPVCKKLDIDYKPDKNIPYVGNYRDGYGRPLHHGKCNCGNYLAAYIPFAKEDLSKNEGLLDYIKDLIKGYNKDGDYYSEGFYEHVKNRSKEIEIRNSEILEDRKRVMAIEEV